MAEKKRTEKRLVSHQKASPSREQKQKSDGKRPFLPRKSGEGYSTCHIKQECGSCRFINEPYKDSLKKKFAQGVDILRQHKVLSRAKILAARPSPKELAYRSVAKLAVREGKDGSFSIGLFQPGSHRVVDVSECPVHVPVINRCVRALRRLLGESDLKPWDEATCQGDLRYLVLRAAHQTQELSLTFVCKDERPTKILKGIVTKLRENLRIQGAYLNCNPDPGNHIFGKKTRRLVGNEKLRESLCDFSLAISPASFFQVNPWQARNLYRRVSDLAGIISGGVVAWDLYSGVGPLSMILARNGYRVLAIEENQDAVKDAAYHCRLNGLEQQVVSLNGRVEQLQEEIPDWGQAPELIVANPSRRGMAPETRQFLKKLLAASQNTRLIYVSCDVTTLARDLDELQKSGHLLRQVEAFDMFAQTDKLEWVAVIA